MAKPKKAAGKSKTKPTKSVSMKDQEQQVLNVGGSLEEQPGPATVVNGRMLAEYVKPHFSRDRNDDRYIALEFSVQLTEAHETILPKSVLAAWEFLRNGGSAEAEGVSGISVKPQTVRIYSTSDAKDEDLLMVGGIVSKARVQIIEEKGSGEAHKFTRYNFRVEQERSKNILAFADWNDGRNFWLEMKATQPNML